jgi:Fe-S-cluster-containing hydrogenase component 2
MDMKNLTIDRSFESGVLDSVRPGAMFPEEALRGKKNGAVVIECPQKIPCNPCGTNCPTGAVLPFEDINDLPRVDYSKCTGCGICVATCPGLACFVVDLAFGEDTAVIKMPYEMLPVPSVGDTVDCLDRVGEIVGRGEVEGIMEPLKDRTRVISVSVKKNLVSETRAIKAAAKNDRK